MSRLMNARTRGAVIGCYDLRLYCEATGGPTGHQFAPEGDGVAEFTGRSEAECLREARRNGWKVGAHVMCRAHAAKETA